MKIIAKASASLALLMAAATHATAGSLEFESGGATLNGFWTFNAPAGSTVRTIAVAISGSVTGPGTYWSASFPGGVWVTSTWYAPTNYVVFDWHDIPPVGYSAYSPPNPQPTSATAVAGIAGPPAGLIHEARATTYDVNGHAYDEKWAYNLVGGTYQVYHGGGSSGGGSVAAYTVVSW